MGDPTELDLDLVPEVQDIVDDLGKYAIYTKITKSGYDISEGSASTSEVDYTVKVTPPDPFQIRYITGEVVESGMLEVLMAAQDLQFTPKLNDRLNFGGDVDPDAPVASGKDYRVTKVIPIYSGEQICAYVIRVAEA